MSKLGGSSAFSRCPHPYPVSSIILYISASAVKTVLSLPGAPTGSARRILTCAPEGASLMSSKRAHCRPGIKRLRIDSAFISTHPTDLPCQEPGRGSCAVGAPTRATQLATMDPRLSTALLFRSALVWRFLGGGLCCVRLFFLVVRSCPLDPWPMLKN
jgi:hypothetical protein